MPKAPAKGKAAAKTPAKASALKASKAGKTPKQTPKQAKQLPRAPSPEPESSEQSTAPLPSAQRRVSFRDSAPPVTSPTDSADPLSPTSPKRDLSPDLFDLPIPKRSKSFSDINKDVEVERPIRRAKSATSIIDFETQELQSSPPLSQESPDAPQPLPGTTQWYKDLVGIEAAGLEQGWPKRECPHAYQIAIWKRLLGWTDREAELFRQTFGSRFKRDKKGYALDASFFAHVEVYASSRKDALKLNSALRKVFDRRLAERVSNGGIPHHHSLILNTLHFIQAHFAWRKQGEDGEEPCHYDNFDDERKRKGGKQRVHGIEEEIDDINPTIAAMLVETYQWVVNGGQLKDAFHYFSMVDVDGRPLLYKDIAAFAQELSTLGHQQAQWIQPWSETGGSVVYEHIPKAWDAIEDCQAHPLPRQPFLPAHDAKDDNRYNERMSRAAALLENVFKEQRDRPRPKQRRDFIVVDYEAVLQPIREYFHAANDELAHFFRPFDFARLSGQVASSITRQGVTTLADDVRAHELRDSTAERQTCSADGADADAAEEGGRKRNQEAYGFTEMRLVESLAFLSAHDQSFALAMGVDYSPLVSKAIGDILQLLLQSIGSSRPGYMCVVAQAMVGTMYHQYLVQADHLRAALDGFLAASQLKVTHASGVIAYKLHDVPTGSVKEGEGGLKAAAGGWCARGCLGDLETGPKCSVCTKGSRNAGAFRDDFPSETRMCNCFRDLLAYHQCHQLLLVLNSSCTWVHYACKVGFGKAAPAIR